MDLIDVGEPADFVAATTFDGARDGFVFRMGDHGIGYYRDDGATKKEQARSSRQPHLQQSIPPVMPPPPPRPPPRAPPPLPTCTRARSQQHISQRSQQQPAFGSS